VMIAGSFEPNRPPRTAFAQLASKDRLGRSDVKFAGDQRLSPKVQTDSYLTLSNA
jgi:hypothetical protein